MRANSFQERVTMMDYDTLRALGIRCRAELGETPPPSRFQSREERAAEMEAALKAGKAPASWDRPWGRVEGIDDFTGKTVTVILD